MAHYKSIRNDKYYREPLLKNKGPKPEIHFYPDATDELIRSDRYDIDWTLSYADCLAKIGRLEDVWTTQMAFANPKIAETYDCFIHYLDMTNDTQKVGLIDFNSRGEVMIKEWV